MEKDGLNDMTDESLMLDIDIIEKEIKGIVAEKDAEIARLKNNFRNSRKTAFKIDR